MRNPFAGRRLARKRAKASRFGPARAPRWRPLSLGLAVEPLEERRLLTTTVYVDFGDRFPSAALTDTIGHLTSTTSGANPNIDGPVLYDATKTNYPAATSFTMTAFNSIYGADSTADRATIMSLVRRFYEPLDVTVSELTASTQSVNGHDVQAAASLADVSVTLGANEGDSENNDAYVLVGQIAIGASNDNPATFATNGYGGFASTTDIGADNTHDNSAIVLLRSPNLYSVGFLADQVAHESSHLLGLRHSFGNDPATPPVGSGIDLAIHQSDLMSYSGYDTFGGYDFFTRYPLVKGDGNTDKDTLAATGGALTAYDQLADDSNIGPSDIEYVTGTGANDIITITKTAPAVATVSVQAFDNADFTGAVTVPGSLATTFSYTIPLGNRILVEGGGRNDRVIVDANLGVTVTLRGMGGTDGNGDDTDELVVLGDGAATGSYTPGTNTAAGADGHSDRRGTVVAGATTIDYQEFDPNSTVNVQDVVNFTYNATVAAGVLAIAPEAGGKGRAASSIGGIPPVPLAFTGITHFTLNTSDSDDQVTVEPGLAPMGLADLTVNGNGGKDTFFVTPSTTAIVNVNGQTPDAAPGDVLVANLAGLAGATIPFGAKSGTIAAPGVQPLNFTSIEQVIATDRFESNDTLATATFLGSEPTVALENLSIDTDTDVDYFRYTAHQTGKLAINANFDSSVGNLTLEVRDAFDHVVATGTATPDGQQIIIPVVGQQTYYVRVAGAAGDLNNYNLELENFATPVPTEVTLDPANDTGASNLDDVTSQTTQVHFFVQTDLADFAAEGITILSPAEATAGTTPGAAVQVFVNGAAVGFATVVAGSDNTLFEINLDADLLKFSAGGPNSAGVLGYPGFTNLITAAVRIFDVQQNSDGVATPATGRGPLSPTLRVVFDDTAPLAPSVPDLLASSDTGPSSIDNFTSVSSPAFSGTGEANTRVRILAGGVVVGQGVVGSDITDGILGNGLGAWEVTVEPLADGTYDVSAVLEDTAGNPSVASSTLSVTIDTLAPQRPTIDLVDSFDSGFSDKDNITNRTNLDFLVSAQAGATVVIKDGNTVIDTFVMPAVAFTTRSLVLANGPHPLSAEATDAAGNRSAQAEQLLVTVDTIDPAVPGIPDLVPTSDSGDSSSDNTTNIIAPGFLGTGEANARVFLFANGSPIGQGVVDTDSSAVPSGDGLGLWGVITSSLVDGPYVIVAFLEDAAGNFSDASGPLSIVIDTLPPQRPTMDLLSAFDTGSSNLDNVTDLNALNFNVTGEIGATMVIKDGETVIDTFVMPAAVVTRTLVLADGSHPLSAEATDTAGNRSAQAAELLVTVDTDPPAPPSTPDLLPSSDSGLLPTDNTTNVNPPAFQGTGEANAKVRILANGVVIGEGVVGSDATDGVLGNGLGHWEVTVEPITDGTYSITAVLEDLAGNISDPSEALLLVLDTTAPQRPTIDLVDAFDTGLSDKDNVTYLPTLNFLVSAEAGSTVVIKDGNIVIDTFIMPAVAFTTRTLVLADGPHPLSAEATDGAGNRSQQSQELLVTVDSVGPPAPSAPDLLTSSDTGTFHDDNVTNLQALAFAGTGEANARVRILANGVVVGQGLVGTDLTDPPTQLPDSPPAIGHWEVTTEPLGDGTWIITVEVEDQAGNITSQETSLTVYVDTVLPNTPYLDLTDASDTGRNNQDNLTFDNTPTVTTTADDVQGAASNAFPHDIRYRIYDRAGTGPDVLLVDSFVSLPGLSTLKFFSDTLTTLADGVHNLKLEVEDRAGNVSPAFLLSVTIDTVAPPVFFGLSTSANDGLDPASDSGVVGDPATFSDRITNVIRPSFWGSAEADALIRMFGDGEHLIKLGEAVAIPLDGNLAFPNGQWNLTSTTDLNNPAIYPRDGIRPIYVTAEDPAGNTSTNQLLNIFLDTQGPQVTSVSITDHPDFNLFGLKPNNAPQGPTPLVFGLTIDLQDFPLEDAQFLRNAIEQGIAATPGLITLRGDHNGLITIDQIIVTNDAPIAGQVATASVRLVFNHALPDDRYTLTIADTLPDVAGNRLDGENNAIEPTGFPLFPSGDGQPGGSFVARFTVDSRAEIGTYAAASVYIDINGNLVYDPQGQNNDQTNRDLTFGLGIVPSLQGVVSPMGIHDGVFAGNFPGQARDGEDGGEDGESTSPAGAALEQWQRSTADGFDKLAAYGYDATPGAFRWLIDTNNDGIIDPAAGDHATIQPAGYQINALPIAGDFDGDPDNGDEIGLFDGTKWYFDTNHNYVIDGGDLVRTTSLRGSPIVGDFNGDAIEDLATWRDDRFYFNFGTQPGGPGTQPSWSGTVDATIDWGLPGNGELPVAADMDGDGITDIGLFLPPRTGTLPLQSGNWEFLISNDFAEYFRGGNQVTALNHPFSPSPLGNDLFAQFGDAFALPIVGNFDPPIASPKMPAPVAMSDVLGTLPMGTHTLDGDEWYSFSPLRNGTILVDAAAASPGNGVTSNLYDADYRLLGSSSATAMSHVTLTSSVTAGQTYLLRLSGDHATANIKLTNQVSDVDRCDTSRDGIVSAIDALRVINELLAKGTTVTPLAATNEKLYLDTNLDGRISPIDALQVINYLIAHPKPSAPAGHATTAAAGSTGATDEPSVTSAAAPQVGSAVAFGLSVSAIAAPTPAAADLVYAQLAAAPQSSPVASPSAQAAVATATDDSPVDSAARDDALATDPDQDWLS